MLTFTEDCLCIYNVIPRVTSKKTIQRDTIKNTEDKSKWNSKKYTSYIQEGKKMKKSKKKTNT